MNSDLTMSSSFGIDTIHEAMDDTQQSSPPLSPWSSQTLKRLDESFDTLESTGFRFFDLPRELRDMVYTMLYGQRTLYRMQSRTAFRSLARVQKRDGQKQDVVKLAASTTSSAR